VEAELSAKVQAIKGARGKLRPSSSAGPNICSPACYAAAAAALRWSPIISPTQAGAPICGRRKEGGNCPNGKTYKLAPIEARVVAALKAQLKDPRAIATASTATAVAISSMAAPAPTRAPTQCLPRSTTP
jgi:hypothetical protein